MILICGASGLVGKELCSLLDDKKIPYIGTYNKNKIDKPNMSQIDFSDPNKLELFLKTENVSCCVFCIVERLVGVCENNWNEIKKTNIDLVHITSYLCNKLNINFIHLSTDYVFDGSKQPNFPNSATNPLQNYGISKLISENRVSSNCENSCIIRTPVLYSRQSKLHDNAVCLIGKNVMDLRSNTKKEDDYCIRRPLYIVDLCEFIYDCILNKHKGVYHFYNPHHKYTKFEMCQKIGTCLNISTESIIPIKDKGLEIAPRPFDTQLQDDKINMSNYNFTDFDASIEYCFSKFKHSKITVQNKDDFLIVLDMDGTIIDSNLAHYNCYKKVFEKYNKSFLDMNQWNDVILNGNVDNYLQKEFGDGELFYQIKQEKRDMLKDELILFTKNSDIFIHFLIENDFNFCVVTNSNKATVEIFKEKLPLLKNIKQWIYREDYEKPKPHTECYEMAKQKYYKNEKYIIGFEDSMVGYNSLKHHTDLIYVYKNEALFKQNDCYLFDDYTNVFEFS